MSGACELSIRRTASGYVVRIAGRGTMRESPAVRDFVSGAIEDGADIWLDLAACDYLDSTFLGCLVLLQQRGRRGRGSFTVLADETVRRRLMSSVQLGPLLQFAASCPPCSGAAVTLPVVNLPRTEFGQHLLETHRNLAELGGPSAESFRSVAEQIEKELGSSPG